MKTRLLLLLMTLALSSCAVVHESSNGTAYGIFSGGLFETSGLIFQ